MRQSDKNCKMIKHRTSALSTSLKLNLCSKYKQQRLVKKAWPVIVHTNQPYIALHSDKTSHFVKAGSARVAMVHIQGFETLAYYNEIYNAPTLQNEFLVLI